MLNGRAIAIVATVIIERRFIFTASNIGDRRGENKVEGGTHRRGEPTARPCPCALASFAEAGRAPLLGMTMVVVPAMRRRTPQEEIM